MPRGVERHDGVDIDPAADFFQQAAIVLEHLAKIGAQRERAFE